MRRAALLRCLAIAVVVFACSLGNARAASLAHITIDPGAYTGRYYIAPFTGFSTGVTTADLADGSYQLDTGASIGGSAFVFTISGGQITSVSNGSADITGGGTTLALRNTSVTIDPGAYTGRYFLSSIGSGQQLVGPHTVVLVPDLVYDLDGGANIVATIGGVPTASDFQFSVSAAGVVHILPGSPSVPATASGSTITLNSVTVHLDVRPATASYLVCSQPGPATYTGSITVTVIPGLVDCVGDGLVGGYFLASPTGVQPAAFSVGALTALATTGTSTAPAALTSATTAFVASSPVFATLPAPLQTALTTVLQGFGSGTSMTPAQKAAYSVTVDVLARVGLLTADQAAVLKTLAART